MADPMEVILVLHAVHDAIDADVATAALPSGTRVRGCVEVCPKRLTLEDTLAADWHTLGRDQRRTWEQDVGPLLAKYPKAGIAYFGLAPIPLAVHLGTLTERWPMVHVYQRRHHAERSWHYAGGGEPKVVGPNGPHERSRSSDPVLLAVGVTNSVDMDVAMAVVGPTSAEVELGTEPLGEDVLVSMGAVNAVGEQFRRALDLVERNRPGTTEAHLFAAVPCGLAFLLGTYVTPTRDLKVVTYQYHRGEEPRYREALRVPERHAATPALTVEQRAQTVVTRAAWEAERKRVVDFLEDRAVASWWNLLGQHGVAFGHGSLAKLQGALETRLRRPIEMAAGDVDGFRFDEKRDVWVFSDELVIAIRDGVPSADVDRAGRMLLLHEALHHGRQGLNAEMARQIRLAPKVLEELDYCADVWAMMHNFAYEQLVDRPWPEQRSGLTSIVDTAVRTMWAFDAFNERGALEVRRVNRYLIWYTQLVRLERAGSFEQALATLADKPVVELVGPLVGVRDNRWVAKLNGAGPLTYELVLLTARGDLVRAGSTNAASVVRLATALGAHDGDAVLETIRGIVPRES